MPNERERERAFPLYTEPIKLKQKIVMRGTPPYDLNITVWASRHTPDNWTVLYSKTYVVEEEYLSSTFELIELDVFDTWYLDIHVTADNKYGKTAWRSGPFGIFLGGYPPTLFYVRIKKNKDMFVGEVPAIELIKPRDVSFRGVTPILGTIEIKPHKSVFTGTPPKLEGIEIRKTE